MSHKERVPQVKYVAAVHTSSSGAQVNVNRFSRLILPYN